MAKTNLVIVESPSKAKTIGKYLGPDYEVVASMGHVRDLPKSTLGVDIKAGFVPDYQPIKGKEDAVKALKKAAKASEKVYLATDPDREGEAISWHLKELLDIPDSKALRVTFNEITQRVVTESIAAPRPLTPIWWMPSRLGVFWTALWAISCRPCCGRRSAEACLQAGFSPLLPGWWWIGKMRSVLSRQKNTGRWM